MTTDELDRKRIRGTWEELPRVVGERKRLEQIHLGVVKQHARWRDPTLKDTWGAAPGAFQRGAEAAISDWTADRRSDAVSNELSLSDVRDNASLVQAPQ